MSPSDRQSRLWLAGSGLKRAIRFATYDWTRELPLSLRVITMIGMGIQGYAIWAALSRSLIWPIMWPSGVILYATILLIYYVGFCIQNATLASELIRKTQLESEQIAAQKIQKTLQPTTIDEIPGYEVDAFYKPLRAVGGDYFDVVDLPGNRTLFVVADVSGKGMAAALLAANIQALVRSLSTIVPDVPALASQINRHLFRYTPGNRFATAAFIVLDRDSGELVYVNAGHNPPIVWRAGQTNFLEATGTALGWFDDTTYEVGRMTIPPGGGLLIYTDGLPDSIPGNSPEDSLYRALDNDLARTMSNLKALVDPRFNEDDVTVLLVKRTASRQNLESLHYLIGCVPWTRTRRTSSAGTAFRSRRSAWRCCERSRVIRISPPTPSPRRSEAEIGAISLQSVYDALAILAAQGLIRRIQPAGSPARFEDRVGDNHHHLICRVCGRVVDVECAVGIGAVSHGERRPRLRDRRGRSRLLGPLSAVHGEVPARGTGPHHPHAGPASPPGADANTTTQPSLEDKGDVTMSSESKCPFSAKSHSGRSNQDWWPNQLNLKVLHQRPPAGDPMGDGLRLRRGVQDPRSRRREEGHRAADDRRHRPGGRRTSATTGRCSSAWRGTARAPTAFMTAAAARDPACCGLRRSAAGPTTPTSTRRAGCSGRSRRSTAGSCRGPT